MLGRISIMALLLPMLTLGIVAKANAQLTTQPTWAVLPFTVNPKIAAAMPNVGNVAAEAVASELARTNLYDVVPQETVRRSAETLGLTLPITDPTTLLRLAQEVRATTIVTGEVVDYKIVNSAGGKQAYIGMNVIVRDVASGLPVNGAGVSSASTFRVGNVPNDVLVNEAIGLGATKAVDMIRTQTLPTGTVLNTTTEVSLINQGTRTGFKVGQKVIITRGREQVATATVSEVEPDQAFLKTTRSLKGIQPGDKVRVIFDVNTILSVTSSGSPVVKRAPRRTSTSPAISLLLVLALGALLLGGGRSNGQPGATQLSAQASSLYAQGSNHITWSADIFHQTRRSNAAWQIYRAQDNVPFAVVDGSARDVYDRAGSPTATSYSSLSDFQNRRGTGPNCDTPDTVPTTDISANPAPSAQTGIQYMYLIELVYGVDASTLANGGSSTTGTCYFLSDKTASPDAATPLRHVVPSTVNPDPIPIYNSNDPSSQTVEFHFPSDNDQGSTFLTYIVEVSDDNSFNPGHTIVINDVNSGGPVQDGSPAGTDVHLTGRNDFYPSRQGLGMPIYWRVGVKNQNDHPGPEADRIGQRYVFGPSKFFSRTTPPPATSRK